MTTQSAEKILIIKHGAFGDIIQAMGAISDIRRHHPTARIEALTTPVYAPIMERCPAIDGVVKDSRAPAWRIFANLGLYWRLRQGGYTQIYDLQNSRRTEFYHRAYLPNTDWCATPRPKGRSHAEENRPRGIGLQRFVNQLSACGLDCVETLEPDVSWMAAEISATLAEAKIEPGFVMLIPGASAKHPQKRWPYYATLAERLTAEGRQVVIAPGPDEPDIEKTIPATCLRGPRGFLNWFELAGLFKAAGFVIGNDTGPSHLAAHIGAPGIALFGSHTTAAKTGIVTRNFTAIEVADLKDLAVEEVLRAMEAHLNEGVV